MDDKMFVKLSGLSSALSFSSKYADLFKEINHGAVRAIMAETQSTVVSEVVEGIAFKQMQTIENLHLDILNNMPQIEIQQSLLMQWEAIAKIINSYQTPALIALRKSFLVNDYAEGVRNFGKALQSNIIAAPDLAFLHNMSSMSDTMGSLLPKGLKSIARDLHNTTAERLANSENISFNLQDKVFFDEEKPHNTASVREANILCSSLEVLGGIDEQDMLDFLNRLATLPNFGIEHRVGKMISENIQSWNKKISFDQELYYHGREFPENGCPYTFQELERAPSGITFHGRFNYPGTSHYYFSDAKKGAILEVRRHSGKDARITLAKISPKNKITMIDLSEDIKGQNKFLEYCRFIPANGDRRNIKREYLIPCFVADCCKRHEIDGVKYYGSKEYKNYVTWTDGHFKCVGLETSD